MSPSICHNFVQNAWKKDLCSNCFKAREEHNISAINGLKPRYITTDSKHSKKPQSIMKTQKKSTKKRNKVNFPKDESEVIGYGGEEWTSDTEEFELSEESPEDAIELAPDDDTERELQKLTKSNTDFNMVNVNLLGENTVTETRRVFASLMLGKTQTDSDGKKQTLHVSVTPFGAQDQPKKLTHQPIAKNKELSLTETKTPVILTAYSNKNETDHNDEKSLLEEINETLEKNKLQIKNNKNEEKNKENVIPDQNVQSKVECVFINTDKKADRKITRHAAIKKDQEKPIILVKEAEVVEAKSPVLVKTEIRYIQTEVLNVESIESRELAGEPDGKADEEVIEPPALPLTPPPAITPPPIDLRPSFLHKPKVPVKPNKITTTIKKIIPSEQTNSTSSSDVDNSDTVSTDSSPTDNTYESLKIPLSKTDSTSSCTDNSRKRRAPKPPTVPTDFQDKPPSPIYTKCERPKNEKSPVVREKEKRERASSCSPKLRNPVGGDSTPNLTILPEPAPRRSISLSQDSLSTPPESDKKKTRGRFSLKKFLRMGNTSTKDLPKDEPPVLIPKFSNLPQPKPRLVIVHPTDLLEETSRKETTRPGKPPPPPRNIQEDHKALPPKNNELLRQQKIWATKAPNPKENIYANVGEVRAILTPSKPVRTASMRERERNDENTEQKHLGGYEPVDVRHKSDDDSSETTENVYDFISSSSNDDPQSSSPQQRSSSPECDSTTPVITNMRPKVDKSGVNRSIGSARRSDGNLDHCSYNIRQNTISLPYCGSETESEIYSPYSFYGSEADVGDDESDWTNSCARTCRLRSRKGRSIVHKNLEDNYGAVIVANHEALAQVLEHMHQTAIIQPALRGLKTAPNLRWSDFSLVENTNNNNCNNITQTRVDVGRRRCFHTALWGAHHVTLALTMEQGSMLQTNTLALAPFTLLPITEFSDLVPSNYLPINNLSESKNEQVTIAVLPWTQVETIQSMGLLLRSKAIQTPTAANTPTSAASSILLTNNGGNSDLNTRTTQLLNSTVSVTEELICREACFIMLQLINGLKCLQAQGIEELPISLTSFALCREIERDTHPRLCVLQGLSEEISRTNDAEDQPNNRVGSLCECALQALKHLLPALTPASTNLISLIEEILKRERAISLTQVKSILEFQLWGPSDVALTTPVKDRELALQRWLDLERATVLHGLVRTRVQLTVFEECHLLFLVRSTAKMMCEASLLLDSIN